MNPSPEKQMITTSNYIHLNPQNILNSTHPPRRLQFSLLTGFSPHPLTHLHTAGLLFSVFPPLGHQKLRKDTISQCWSTLFSNKYPGRKIKPSFPMYYTQWFIFSFRFSETIWSWDSLIIKLSRIFLTHRKTQSPHLTSKLSEIFPHIPLLSSPL